MALLGPTRLFIFGKSSHLHCFLRNKYQKSPTYTPLLRPTRLLVSEKTVERSENSGVPVLFGGRNLAPPPPPG